MKKILLSLLILFLGFFTASAQYDEGAIEQINNFESQINVQKDSSIEVIEKITVNAQHDRIKRGIYREIPLKRGEDLQIIGLEMDGEEHPYFIEKGRNAVRVNFGNDDYIEKGIHTYKLTYHFLGAIDSYTDYEELYWNVTGNNWVFPIQKAEAIVKFPEEVVVKEEGISVYTGKNGEKGKNADWDELRFKTTRPLASYEGLTIAIPFEKGVIIAKKGKLKNSSVKGKINIVSVGNLIGIVLLGVLCWVGFTNRSKRINEITSTNRFFAPPIGMSAGMMSYLNNKGNFNIDMFSCTLLGLAMNGFIEIKYKKGFFTSETKMTLLPKSHTSLTDEEYLIVRKLFKNVKSVFTISKRTSITLKNSVEKFQKLIEQKGQKYLKKDKKMKMILLGLVIALGIIPFIFVGNKICVIFMLVNMWVLLMCSDSDIAEVRGVRKIVDGILFFFIPSGIWISMCAEALDFIPPLVIYIMGVSVYLLCKDYAYNLTEKGKIILKEIIGFKQYMKTAEIYRVESSNPLEKEQLYCKYLPIAFAFEMGNKWMRQFGHILSTDKLEQLMSHAGGSKFVRHSFVHVVRNYSTTTRGGGRGSFGGGFSGGGHGGGGGGGR